jgi:hypothetical protein
MAKSVEIAPGDRVNVTARPDRIGVRGLALGVAGGALLAFLFDPDRGRSRRAVAADRVAGTGRRALHRMGRAGRWTGATVQGWVARAQHLGSTGETNPDDATLADRVETEVFRDSDVPKGRMNVNVENGIVVVRGTVDDQALISTIERRIQRIPGVAGVRNLLHLTGTPAPTSAERSTASASR